MTSKKNNFEPDGKSLSVHNSWLGAGPVLPTVAMVVLFIFILTCPGKANAYTVELHNDAVTGQFVISPTKVELEMKPGETASRDILIANRTGTTLTIAFSLEDFEGSKDPSQATVFMGDEDSAWGARHWLEPEIASIVLKHGETVTFRTKVSVPTNAEPGGHYAVLFASSTYESQNEQGSAINITSQIGALFLIRVAGAVHEEGTLDIPELPAFSESGPIDIGLVFNNLGNVHLKPLGRVLITNFLGQTVAEIPVPEWIVLPESSRRNIVKWDSNFLFGRYTARAEIGYTADGSPIIASGTFWVIPWKIILATLAAVIAATLLVSWIVRRKRAARQKLEDELEHLRAAQDARISTEVAAESAASMPEAPDGQQQLVALDELFPSIGDNSIIDLDDMETQKLIHDLIGQELDLARVYISEGKTGKARNELMEARSAAQRIGLLADIGIIDDMLQQL